MYVDEESCPECEKDFQEGDMIVFLVVKISDDEHDHTHTLMVPVHYECMVEVSS